MCRLKMISKNPLTKKGHIDVSLWHDVINHVPTNFQFSTKKKSDILRYRIFYIFNQKDYFVITTKYFVTLQNNSWFVICNTD